MNRLRRVAQLSFAAGTFSKLCELFGSCGYVRESRQQCVCARAFSFGDPAVVFCCLCSCSWAAFIGVYLPGVNLKKSGTYWTMLLFSCQGDFFFCFLRSFVARTVVLFVL